MKQREGLMKRSANRRSFLKKGVMGAGAAAIAAGLPPGNLIAFDRPDQKQAGAPPSKGDIAILTFLSALEQVEADLWVQYAELGGPTNAVPGAQGELVRVRAHCQSDVVPDAVCPAGIPAGTTARADPRTRCRSRC